MKPEIKCGRLDAYIETLDNMMDSVSDMRVPHHSEIFELLDKAADLMAKAKIGLGADE